MFFTDQNIMERGDPIEVMVIKRSKMAYVLYFLLMIAKNLSIWAIQLNASERSHLAL